MLRSFLCHFGFLTYLSLFIHFKDSAKSSLCAGMFVCSKFLAPSDQKFVIFHYASTKLDRFLLDFRTEGFSFFRIKDLIIKVEEKTIAKAWLDENWWFF